MKTSLLTTLTLSLFLTTHAHAGVPECGNNLIDADASCELIVDADCSAQCDIDSGLIGQCAANLAASCDAGCTAEITEGQEFVAEEFCAGLCDNDGVVVCSDNCQGECDEQCPAQCEGAEDEERCLAGCASSCDVECDQRCGTVDTNSGCYQHCIECMKATHHVEVNIECQIGCQADGFAECEAELASACEGSCDGDGSLFCDGQLVATGNDTVDCMDALWDMGIGVAIDAEVDASTDFDIAPDAFDSVREDGVSSGCSVDPGGTSRSGLAGWLGLGLLLVGVGRVRRRA